jgi:hypothetical protein
MLNRYLQSGSSGIKHIPTNPLRKTAVVPGPLNTVRGRQVTPFAAELRITR